jgi:hypothetical protein
MNYTDTLTPQGAYSVFVAVTRGWKGRSVCIFPKFCFLQQTNKFYATDTQRLTQRWEKCLDNDADFVEE